MADKEGGDSEKKMTKDFLDRWKKIASKYEGPEDEQAAKKEAETGKGPAKPKEEELDRFLAEIASKDTGGDEKSSDREEDELELDGLMSDFGLEAEKQAAPERRAAETKVPAAPAPPAPAAPKAPAAAQSSADEAQKRVLDTLKKVGLVRAPEAPPPPPPPRPKVEEEDTLLLELESLLSSTGPTAKPTPEAEKDAAGALEEEDLISELEGLLEGGGEEESPRVPPPPPVKVPAAPPPARVSPPAKAAAPAAKPVDQEEEEDEVELRVETIAPALKPPIAEIKPPAAPIASPVSSPEARGGRVNGGRTNGGRVNGGRTNGGRVNGGRTNGGRVNGGRTNGGRVNGGRVNGGRVNGGRVNGGRVNGGRVNGGRIGANLAPLVRAQNRRQTITAGIVAGIVIVGLFTFIPFGGAPRGPAVDGDISDWSGSGALFYTDAQDSNIGLPPAIDLREYAIRTESGRLWFEARAEGNLFTRAVPFPSKADHLIILIDIDGSSGTGYAYRDLGIDRVVDVNGWDGVLRSSATRAWANRAGVPTYDFSGFDTAGGLQVAVQGQRIEGTLTGLSTGVGSAGIDSARAVFELRGVDSSNIERTDTNSAPATLSGTAISATVTAVAPDQLLPGAPVTTAMLSIALSNPSPQPAQVSGIRLSANYALPAPADPATFSLWNDANGNRLADASEQRLTAGATPLPNQASALLTFAQPLTLGAGTTTNVLAVVEHVPTNAAVGTALEVTVSSASDIQAGASTFVTLVRAGVLANAQPSSYLGGAPATPKVDGNTFEWLNRSAQSDRAQDIQNGHADLLSLQGNITPAQSAFLVSFASSPLDGAVVPVRLGSTLSLPNTGGGGGGGGSSGTPPANYGADFVWLMADADNDTATGFVTGGHGYDFAVRVDGKAGQVLPDGAKFFVWETAPARGWALVPQSTPAVGIGAKAIEIGMPIPAQNLTGRTVAVTAYATDWLGARDDLDQPLLVGNAQGSRASPLSPADPEPVLREPPSGPAPIPEFQDVAVPAAFILLIAGLSRRRARKLIT